eukprot:1157378-Pelagomonas_calceolata.AAC.4
MDQSQLMLRPLCTENGGEREWGSKKMQRAMINEIKPLRIMSFMMNHGYCWIMVILVDDSVGKGVVLEGHIVPYFRECCAQ